MSMSSVTECCAGCGMDFRVGNVTVNDDRGWKYHVECAPAKEAVNHPQHYGGDTTYETIKVLEAWMTPEQISGFLLGNTIKYVSRAGKKDNALEDLKKARWYLDREIGRLES